MSRETKFFESWLSSPEYASWISERQYQTILLNENGVLKSLMSPLCKNPPLKVV